MAPKHTTAILKKLRDVMKNTNYVTQHLHAYIIPSCDAHQSEYIAHKDKRREYVSGFSGSAGTAIVTQTEAALWTDGRYFLQAEKEMDENWILMKDLVAGTPTFSQWLGKVLSEGNRVGVDPKLMPFNTWKTLSKELRSLGLTLEPISTNLVDVIYEESFFAEKKPIKCLPVLGYPSDFSQVAEFFEFPGSKLINCHPVEYAGESWQEKVSKVRKEMAEEKASVHVISALDQIAWLFNLRGFDIPYNPVFFAYAAVTMDTVYLFLDSKKLTDAAKDTLLNEETELLLLPYESVTNSLEYLAKKNGEGKFWISGTSSYALISHIPKERRLVKESPIAMHKAIKNKEEIESARSGHIRDAAALCEFFRWVSENIGNGNITEMDAAAALHKFRRSYRNFVCSSFGTISSSGPNSAIIHYQPDEESNRKLHIDEIYLCDSGAQYSDGATTDVTRTLHFGTPRSLEKKIYTLVLKGHIALSTAIFPKSTKGYTLDSFARKALWEHGYDYAHGTGHGVGSYLNVHEGPVYISYRYTDRPGLEAGMITSIEPGCYLDGEFGVRLENLALVKEVETLTDEECFAGAGFLTFEPLTLVPFQSKLIDPSLLTAKEIEWVNAYHAKCRDVVGKVLESENKLEALKWLLQETTCLG